MKSSDKMVTKRTGPFVIKYIIDTTGWCKWILGDDNFPTLDYNTEWNGTEWVKVK